MSAQHTPGPWAVTSSYGDVHSQARNGGNWICQGPNEGALSAPAPVSERLANAHLIAAAPELLEALEALVKEAHLNMVGGAGHLIDDAYAAIAKATGAA